MIKTIYILLYILYPVCIIFTPRTYVYDHSYHAYLMARDAHASLIQWSAMVARAGIPRLRLA